jgi:hypothetical protein
MSSASEEASRCTRVSVGAVEDRLGDAAGGRGVEFAAAGP